MVKGKTRLVVLLVVMLKEGVCEKEETNKPIAATKQTNCFMILHLMIKNYLSKTLYPAFTVTFTSFIFFDKRVFTASIPAVVACAPTEGSSDDISIIWVALSRLCLATSRVIAPGI